MTKGFHAVSVHNYYYDKVDKYLDKKQKNTPEPDKISISRFFEKAAMELIALEEAQKNES